MALPRPTPASIARLVAWLVLVFLAFILLHGWANVTNTIAVSVMASPVVPLATAGVTWLFVAWLLRRYGAATLRAGPAGATPSVG